MLKYSLTESLRGWSMPFIAGRAALNGISFSSNNSRRLIIKRTLRKGVGLVWV